MEYQRERPSTLSFILKLPFLHFAVLFKCCSAAEYQVAGVTAIASGVPGDRIVTCRAGGNEHVVQLQEMLLHNSSSSSSFTLNCEGPNFEVIPKDAGEGESVGCTDTSSLQSCQTVPLETLDLSASVHPVITNHLKHVQWTVESYGFPRYPRKLRVGCMVQPPATADQASSWSEGQTEAEPHTLYKDGGCLVRLAVGQAPPLVENNIVECTYAETRTVTPVVAVTARKPFVAIRCGNAATSVPPHGRYCLSAKLESCISHSLGTIFPLYSDTWWEVEDDGRVLTVPVDQLQRSFKQVFFGCMLPNTTAHSKEALYCAVPVLFDSAAHGLGEEIITGSSAGVWLTVLCLFSSSI